MKNLNQLVQQLENLEDRLVTCMKCGMCQSVCPVFGASLMEADVARGKLALVDNLSNKIIKDADAVMDKLGRCLLCGSCQANCPSGVPITEIFLESREIVTAYLGLNPIKKLVFRGLLAKPALFSSLASLGTKFQFLVFKKNNNLQETSSAPLFKKIIGARHFRELPKTSLYQEVGELNTNSRSNKPKVAFFAGCLGDKFYTNVSKAAIDVLKHHDVGIYMPNGLACCGIPAISSGDIDGMIAQTKINLHILKNGNFDYLITACGSCTSTIKELWPHYSPRFSAEEQGIIKNIAAKTLDINEFLIDILKVDDVAQNSLNENKKKITYHDSCHLKKSLNVHTQPRSLLQLNNQYELKEMKEADRCCGCGGSFTLFHYDLSYKIGLRKRENILSTGAEIVTTACPACMLQLEDVLSQNNDNVKVKHVIEIYADSLK